MIFETFQTIKIPECATKIFNSIQYLNRTYLRVVINFFNRKKTIYVREKYEQNSVKEIIYRKCPRGSSRDGPIILNFSKCLFKELAVSVYSV